MADQGISVFLQLKDQLSAGMSRVSGVFDNANASASDMLDSFQNMSVLGVASFSSIAAGAAQAVAAIGELNREGIDLNRQFENTSVRIAGTLKAFNVTPTFAKAEAEAAGVMSTVAELAAVLPGETEDYISVFATALPKVLAAGMTDMQKAAEFTSQFTAVASSNMVDSAQAGMDLFRMLAGQAGADVRMWTVLAEKFGMTAQEFNKLSGPERLARIQEAIGAFSDQLTRAGDTFDAKSGEMESRLKEIKRVSTEVSFERAKGHLEEMNSVLRENREEFIRAGQLMTAQYQEVSQMVDKIVMGWKLIGVHTLKAYSDMPPWFQNLLKAALPGGTLLPGATVGPSAAGTAAGGAAGKGPGAVAAAISEYDRRADELAERVGQFEAEQYQKVLDLLPEKMRRFMEVQGPSGWLTDTIYEELISIGKARWKMTDPDDRLMANKIANYLEFMRPSLADTMLAQERIFGIESEGAAKARTAKEKERHKKSKGHVTNFYNSRFDIKQEFAEGFDPDRIAVAFSQDLARLGEMKVMSGYAPLFTGS